MRGVVSSLPSEVGVVYGGGRSSPPGCLVPTGAAGGEGALGFLLSATAALRAAGVLGDILIPTARFRSIFVLRVLCAGAAVGAIRVRKGQAAPRSELTSSWAASSPALPHSG